MFFFGTFTHRHEKDAKTDADLGWRDADQWEVVQSIFQCFQEELNFRRCWNERMIINIVMEWESFSFYLSIQLEPDRPLLLVPEWGVICDGSECKYTYMTTSLADSISSHRITNLHTMWVWRSVPLGIEQFVEEWCMSDNALWLKLIDMT